MCGTKKSAPGNVQVMFQCIKKPGNNIDFPVLQQFIKLLPSKQLFKRRI